MTEQPSRRKRPYLSLIKSLGLQTAPRHISPIDLDSVEGQGGVTAADLTRKSVDGERTAQLTRIAGAGIQSGSTAAFIINVCRAWNAGLADPLDDRKICNTVESIARTHARNHPSSIDPSAPLFDFEASGVGRFLDNEPPRRDWLFEEFLPARKVALLVAPGGTGKSQFVLQLAHDLACGEKRFSPWTPSAAQGVLILSAEDEEEEMHRRLSRLVRTDVAGSDFNVGRRMSLLRANLRVVARVAESNLMTSADDREVRRTDYVDRLAATVGLDANLGLIVLDPVSRFRGGEENAAADTTRFVEAAERLSKLVNCAVLLVHHTKKGSGSEQTQENSRGSSALTDGVRLQVNLSVQSGSGPNQLLEVKITKTNYSRPSAPIILRRDDDGRLLPLDTEAAKSAKDDMLLHMLMRVLLEEEAAGRFYSKSTFAAEFGGPKGEFGMGIGALTNLVTKWCGPAGLIEIDAGKNKHLRVRKGSSRN